jgi:hypothetical protein
LDSHADELEYLALARSHHFSFRLGRMDGLNRASTVRYARYRDRQPDQRFRHTRRA